MPKPHNHLNLTNTHLVMAASHVLDALRRADQSAVHPMKQQSTNTHLVVAASHVLDALRGAVKAVVHPETHASQPAGTTMNVAEFEEDQEQLLFVRAAPVSSRS
jgi:uncharacterized membrane protein